MSVGRKRGRPRPLAPCGRPALRRPRHQRHEPAARQPGPNRVGGDRVQRDAAHWLREVPGALWQRLAEVRQLPGRPRAAPAGSQLPCRGAWRRASGRHDPEALDVTPFLLAAVFWLANRNVATPRDLTVGGQPLTERTDIHSEAQRLPCMVATDHWKIQTNASC
jgi:hypothetical protein